MLKYLIIGSGLAGLYTAHKAAAIGSVMVVTKKGLRDSNSFNAQGGIAAVTDIEDNPELHFTDTVIAGRGLCEDKAVHILVKEGPQRIREIIEEGMKFDTENGKISLGLEGGHHKKRILHAGGDSTGRFMTEFLISKVENDPNIQIRENISVIDFLVKDGVCYGARCWNEIDNKEELIYAEHTFLTSGGTSAIYTRTTNPETTIGDGIAMSYKAGCRIVDMEFIQFHPSALYIEDSPKAFLISEAVRGEGAHLLGKDGKRFMLPIHELAELAPRDIVARSIFKQMALDDRPYVILSLKHLNADKIRSRFPTILARCAENGYDLTQQIPVAPAAHYTVGGVASDEYGRSDVSRLYVCGEIASTGIMGANRLASNSLIECLVFANRAIEISKEVGQIDELPEFELKYHKDPSKEEAYLALKRQIAHTMNNCSGIIRSELLLSTGLNLVKKELKELGPEKFEYYDEASRKLLTVAFLIMTAARFRRESRGGHYREDYPTLNEEYAVHTIQRVSQPLTTKKVNE
ncbi:MAG: L-aspartate oxidase [Bacteroidales bacterium]|nr:L-aspartate oxidase [Bacteroidales bacterium]MDY5824381.1 L-aspartate oxidase [Candidatus Coprenecus sp.]